jgi:hypothetical protein
VLTRSIQPISGLETAESEILDLSGYFSDPDDKDAFTFEITAVSDTSIADPTINGNELSVDFKSPGQSKVILKASSGGKDISAEIVIGVQPEITEKHIVSDFEDLTLDPESHWNGADGSGAFSSGMARFHNSYNPDWLSWSGWAYTNSSDRTTPGYYNQYSAITGYGFDNGISRGTNYGVSYISIPSVVDFTGEKAHAVAGFFVTNSTYTALSMKKGDMFSKKFGGADGSDPDYLKLMVWGKTNGTLTDSIEYYLADFRSESSIDDYIIKTWQWVDISTLGKVDSLMFALTSSDVGDWGMNTPGYFCLDDMHVIPDQVPEVSNPIPDLYFFIHDTLSVLNIKNVFTDPDDDDESIMLAIRSNSNIALVNTFLAGEELKLTFPSGEEGEAEIVIEGISNGMTIADTFHVTVESGLGLESLTPTYMIVYPNPNNGTFRIRTERIEMLAVKVFTMTGIMIYDEPHYMPGQYVDISRQPSGNYIIRITGSKAVFSGMIHKQ